MEHFNNKRWVWCTCVWRHLKEVLVWVIDKWLYLINIVMLLKTVIYTSKELKNKAIVSFENNLCP